MDDTTLALVGIALVIGAVLTIYGAMILDMMAAVRDLEKALPRCEHNVLMTEWCNDCYRAGRPHLQAVSRDH